ncbi:extracellular solute-binding protein [Peptoniphilus obesi]|uniref:extracellular solute-binding protein n=1 Tax=Peptoniphilus obesi TaxID=1472765 RepID=UPI0004B38293|nr:extracellular solute-binding protein [Peptoniphilus obesi]
MKIKIKKSILSLFLIMLMSFAFVGCNNKNDESINATANETKKEEATGETKKLVIAARGGSHVDAINSVKESFEKENNVEIEILGLEADDLKQRVSLDSQNSEGSYDVVMIDDPWMSEWAEGDVLLNLSDNGVKKDDDFIEASQNVGTYPYKEGDIYALPFNGNVMMFFYNEQLLKENSIEVPTDWESVLQAAKTVKKTGKNGYIIRGQQGNPIVTDYLPILWAYGGDVFDKDNNITIDSQEAIDALNLYIELYKNGENYEKNDLIASVSDGNGAMTLGWPSWFIQGSESTAQYSKIPGKKDKDSKENPAGMLGNWMIGVASNTKNKDLAVKFVEFITSSDAQKTMAENGGTPTRHSVYQDKDLKEKFPYFETMEQAIENGVVRPRLVEWSEMEEVLGTELSAAVAGQKDAKTALIDAKAGMESIKNK